MSRAVCPWWLGYFLLNPLRKLIQDPEKMLAQYVRDGMWVMDIGCGMGYFTLPLARMVGDRGRVLAIDLQAKMIAGLERRAVEAGLAARIEARACASNWLGVDDYAGKLDFVLAFAVIHEVTDQDRLLAEVYRSLKPGGRLLVSEPSFHVTREDFDKTLAFAQGCGFRIVEFPRIKMSVSAVLAKEEG